MKYNGKYSIMDVENIKTYSIFNRPSEVSIKNLVDTDKILKMNTYHEENQQSKNIKYIAKKIVNARKEKKPVIVFSGAHMIKNGLGPIYIDLIKRGYLSVLGTNGAFTIHDFELAFAGKTSENIPNALSKGLFGFSEETNKLMNLALRWGNKNKVGYGESMGKLISGEIPNMNYDFPYKDYSVIYNAFIHNIPLCVHCGIGNDIIHMTGYFDGESLGGCSGRDFLIYANEISKLNNGGVCLLIGSSVIGVEVILKAFSMSSNLGKTPNNITTASFDIREANVDDAIKNDKAKSSYYFRDIKSMVVRIPEAFNGKGFYIKGNHKETVVELYRNIMEYGEKNE